MNPSAFDDFAGYRMLKRRLTAAQEHDTSKLFFQSRKGLGGSAICREGRPLTDFGGYDYLGLATHPEVIGAAKAAIDRYGTSASASRIVSGQTGLHAELEARLAHFLGCEASLVFVSGYLTNVTVIDHLFSRPDLIVHDAAAHNSIQTGSRLSGAEIRRFAHQDWEALDALMVAESPQHRRRLLAVEGLYSMDGDRLDLDRALAAKDRYGMLLMVDEAHSIGTTGATGRGICEHAGQAPDRVDIHMGTLSKALASCGGYIAGQHALIEHLRYLAPGFIFSVGLSPADCAAALAALNVLEREPERVDRLRDRARHFSLVARQHGLTLSGAADSPVASLVAGSADRCMRLSRRLLERGVQVPPVLNPAVPIDRCRLRFFLTITHTDVQIEHSLDVLAEELNVMAAAE
jgi:8-amino-7-oxononanoate synthase